MAKLYQWYTEAIPGERVILHGVVTGHRKLPDGILIYTSPIQQVLRDPECEDGYIFESKNTTFYVSMSDCDYGQCTVMENSAIPGLELWRSQLASYSERYAQKPALPAADCGSVLLRLGNNREYYFDSMDVHSGTGEYLNGDMQPHVGMFQDSVLCWAGGEAWCSDYDLRYFPYRSGNLEFYGCDTEGLPVYIENCGDCELMVKFAGAVYKIAPGSRVLMERANAMPGATLTSEQDLYTTTLDLSDAERKKLAQLINHEPNTKEES